MQNENVLKGHCGWFASTIGNKQIIGITGLGLCGFLFTHMLGNMLILVGPQAYNEYSHALVTNHLILFAEAGLLGLFLAHFMVALKLSWNNSQARDTRYAVMSNGAKRTSWTQRTMWIQGIVILVFAVLHLLTMKFGTVYTVTYGTTEMRDLHKLVIEVFHQPLYVAWYIVALIVLGFHVSHGLGSSLQTLGIHHPRYQNSIKCASVGYAVVVMAGFISQPLYVFFMS